MIISQPLFAQGISDGRLLSERFQPAYPTLWLASSGSNANPRFYDNLWDGVSASFNKWDIPILAGYWLTQKQRSGQIISLGRSKLDHEVTEHLARSHGGPSLGSVNPYYYPLATGTARLAGMVLLDAVSDKDFSPSSYSKLISFHKSLFYTIALTKFAKRNFSRRRPDGSDTRSFLSGHTAIAFATSTFLYLEASEYIDHLTQANHDLPVLSNREWKLFTFAALYGWAGYVGVSRIIDRRHYFSDVAMGALSGTLISHILYPRSQTPELRKGIQLGLQPVPDGVAFGIRLRFGQADQKE